MLRPEEGAVEAGGAGLESAALVAQQRLLPVPSSLGVLMELGGCLDGNRPETAVE